MTPALVAIAAVLVMWTHPQQALVLAVCAVACAIDVRKRER